jgi:hypothetical protein
MTIGIGMMGKTRGDLFHVSDPIKEDMIAYQKRQAPSPSRPPRSLSKLWKESEELVK